jgi:hypothetical protein
MYSAITNQGQNANNLLKFTDDALGCCPDVSVDACQYDVTLPTANAVNNIIISRNGVAETLTTGFPATGAASVKVAIKAALVAAGYEDNADAVVGVSSVVSGSNIIYSITGHLVVVSMKHNSATTVNAVAKCTRINRCSFFYAWPGSATTVVFNINGVDANVTTLTLAGSTAANVVTMIEGLANWPTTADVVVTETADAFEITITDNGTAEFILDGNTFVRSDCAPGYEA